MMRQGSGKLSACTRWLAGILLCNGTLAASAASPDCDSLSEVALFRHVAELSESGMLEGLVNVHEARQDEGALILFAIALVGQCLLSESGPEISEGELEARLDEYLALMFPGTCVSSGEDGTHITLASEQGTKVVTLSMTLPASVREAAIELDATVFGTPQVGLALTFNGQCTWLTDCTASAGCTSVSCTSGTTCTGVGPCTTGDDCTNGDYCTAGDFCTSGDACTQYTGCTSNEMACTASGECTKGTGCTESSACTQGYLCTEGAMCTGGTGCTAGTDCTKGTSCTANEEQCTNGDSCTGSAGCTQGNSCTYGPGCTAATNCTNGPQCTGSEACTTKPSGGVHCTDGDACTAGKGGEYCSLGPVCDEPQRLTSGLQAGSLAVMVAACLGCFVPLGYIGPKR